MIKGILTAFHSSIIGGHSGIKQTLSRISNIYFWKTLRADVQEFVNTSPICQITKYQPLSPAGLLQPLPTLERIWEEVTIDFIIGLPNSYGKTAIMVVVDCISKYAYFSALSSHFTSLKIANFFINDICKLHGIPQSIISYRDQIFMSSFWKELF